MGVKTIRVTKNPLPQPIIRLVQGDSRTQIIRFKVEKNYGGYDLTGLAWSVWVHGFDGEAEVSYIGSGTVSGDDIILNWTVNEAATKVPGITVLKLYGSKDTNGTPRSWVSGNMQIAVTPTQMIDPGYDEDEVGRVRQLIEDMNGAENTLKTYADNKAESVASEKVSSLKTAIGGASDWDTATTYSKGAYVMYGNAMYKCIASCKNVIPYGNADNWTRVTLASVKKDLEEAEYVLSTRVNPNMIDNWYLADPVNQRGESTYRGAVYTVDRWYAAESDAVTYVSASGYVSCTKSLYQKIPEIPNKTLTISVLFSDGTMVWGTAAADENNGYYSGDVRAWIDRTNSRVFIRNVGVGIRAVKLELGDRQTLAHQVSNGAWALNEIPDHGDQLRRCQQYYYRYDGAYTLTMATSSAHRGFLFFPVPMISVPSITFTVNTGTVATSDITVYKDHCLIRGTSSGTCMISDVKFTVAGYGG